MIYVTRPTLPDIQDYADLLKGIWERGWLTNNGVLVRQLEGELKEYLGVKNLSLVTNATMGLLAALYALDLEGEVITTPFTFAATTNVLFMKGLTPVFADVDPETFNIDPVDVERRITKKTSAILAVHVFGNPCNITALEKIAKKYKLKLIFDAAHAFGVRYKGKSICEYGDISVLSFHAVKLFNTVEGGAVITKTKELTRKCELFRNFGFESEEEIVSPGINAKMSEFHAAMGLCNLKSIKKVIEKNKRFFDLYMRLLGGTNVKFQKPEIARVVHTYMPVCFDSKATRDKAHEYLMKSGYSSRKYFYPLTSDFEYLRGKSTKTKIGKELINAKNISDTILCLPLYPTMEKRDIEKICKLVKEVC